MLNTFVTGICIDRVRHLKKIEIEISNTQRKHLILTGKNGSGKTSLLEAMRDNVLFRQSGKKSKFKHAKINHAIEIKYNDSSVKFSRNIFAHIPPSRSKLVIPEAIELIEIEGKTLIKENKSKDFLKYVVGLDYQLYGAKADNDTELEKILTKWFDNFLKALQNIYDCNKLSLKRDAKNFLFKIQMPGREPFALHEMSDGYAAFLNIIMELLMRLETDDAVVDYEKSAIVLIDEIETNLHVDLQKKALPFLTQMFPNVQFIVATHSPFVMTSLENAVVYDLEKNERLENPSFYSYDTIVESFLDTSLYSNQLQKYFARYKELCLKERTPEEHDEFLQVKSELEIRAIPSTELYIAFQKLETERKAAKNGTS
ncbi:MAG: AAA family ATPase [Defluviitaleaceae bacterium]|nr:AAA family ATPase [Defluviitaleaceae bacterium]